MSIESAPEHTELRSSVRAATKNFAFLSLGQLAYRASTFALLAVYANALGPQEFGRLEQLLALSLLMVPLVSMLSYEAFLPHFGRDPAGAASTAVCLLLVGETLALLCCVVLAAVDVLPGSVAIVLAVHVGSVMAWQYVRNLCRLLGLYSVVMTGEMIQAGLVTALGLLLLLPAHLGMLGAVVAIAVGNTFSVVFVVSRSASVRQLVVRNKVGLESVRAILSVSGRLVPNVLIWWGIELSDRFLLGYFEGAESVGIYSAGARVAGVLMAVVLVIYQVWQVPAVRRLAGDQVGGFFKTSLNLYMTAVLLGASALGVIVGPLIDIFLGLEFVAARQYAAILIPATCVSALCYFFGVIYYSPNSEKSATVASAVGLLVSVSLNLVLIPRVGAVAAAWATLLAYAVVALIRIRQARGLFRLGVENLRLLVPAALLGAQCMALYLDLGIGVQVVMLLLLLFATRSAVAIMASGVLAAPRHGRL